MILKNFEILRHSGKDYIIKTPLIPGITDTNADLEMIEAIIPGSKREKLPYDTTAGAKYKMHGMKYEL